MDGDGRDEGWMRKPKVQLRWNLGSEKHTRRWMARDVTQSNGPVETRRMPKIELKKKTGAVSYATQESRNQKQGSDQVSGAP
jgi:hypothetical protein